jgi:hypothetical protein
MALDHGPHRTIEDEDALGEQTPEMGFEIAGHSGSPFLSDALQKTKNLPTSSGQVVLRFSRIYQAPAS